LDRDPTYNFGNKINQDECGKKGIPPNSQIPSIGRGQWHGGRCDLLNDSRINLIKERIIAINLKELIIDDALGEDHENVSIISCPTYVTQIMLIWNGLKQNTLFEGQSTPCTFYVI
jgi:hypothetical protein